MQQPPFVDPREKQPAFVDPRERNIDPAEAQKITDAMVFSHMTGAPPSQTYDLHDQLHQDFTSRLGQYAEAGWKGFTKDSIIGMSINGESSGPFESDDDVSKFIEGFGTMIADLPYYIAGGAIGAFAGDLAGSEVPVVGNVLGAAIGGGAGAFALPAALRQMLVDGYAGKKIESLDGFLDALKAAGKGAITGAAFGAAGEIAPIAGGVVGKYLGPKAYKAAAELATITTVGSVLEGKVPTAKDFAQNAALLALMHVTVGQLSFAKDSAPELQSKAMKMYVQDNVHPAEVVSESARQESENNPMEIVNRIDNAIAQLQQPEETPRKEQEPVQTLRPALKEGDRVTPGNAGKTHSDLMAKEGIAGEHGFIDPEGNYLNREEAKAWVDKNEPEIAENLPDRPLHTEDYNEAVKKTTSIKNAVTTAEREERGLSPVEIEARQVPAFEEGKEAVTKGAIDARKLAESLAANPRPHTDVEAAALLFDRMQLHNQYGPAIEAVNKARESGNQNALDLAIQNRDQIEDAMEINDEASRKSGTETGRALAARRMMINSEYSLETVIARAKAASPTGEISDEQRQQLEDLTNQLSEAQKKVEEYEEQKKQLAAEQVVERLKKEKAARTEKRQVERKAIDEEYDALIKDLNAELKLLYANPMLNPKLYALFGKLAVNRIEAGFLTIDQIVDDLHEKLKERAISKREIRDYISGYGRTVELSKDQIKVKLREARAQGRLLSALEDAQKKQVPLKSGLQRGKPSAEVLKLQKQVKDAMRDFPVEKKVDPEKQWKTALQSVKTRLKSQLEEIVKRIETGVKPDAKKPIQDDWESEDLKWQRDFLKRTLEEIEGKPDKPKMTDEQKVKMATAAVEKSIKELERRIQERDLKPAQRPAGPETPKLKALRDKRDALQKTLDTMKADAKPKTTAEQRQIKSLAKQIDTLSDRLKKGIVVTKGKRQGPDTEKVSALKAQRDALRGEYEKLKEAGKPQKSPEEIQLQRYKSALSKRMADLQRKLDTGDYSNPTRKATLLDKEAMDLRIGVAKLKSKVDDAINKQKLEARSPVEKAKDTFLKWRRSVLISSATVGGKIVNASAQRFGATIVEELVGGVLSQIPGLDAIADKADREGGGLNISAEAKAAAEVFSSKTAEDAWNVLKTGKSSLDYLYGKKNTPPPQWVDFVGHIHGALQTPIMRAEFARSYEIRAQKTLNRGMDIEDPNVMMTNGSAAYIDAERAVFRQENVANTIYRRIITTLQQHGLSAKAAAFMLELEFPIVKLPTNIVGETLDYTTGVFSGSIKAAKVLITKDGMANLTGQEADNILRSLKKGSVGLAIFALGYYAGSSSGVIQSSGFYEPGDSKEKPPKQFLKIGDKELPTWILDTPIGLTFQLGATVRRVHDYYVNTGRSGGFVNGAVAGSIGLAKKVPFVDQSVRTGEALRNADTAGLFLDDVLESLVVPPDVRKYARSQDPLANQRKPTDLKETIEKDIPGMQDDVPLKPKKSLTRKRKF